MKNLLLSFCFCSTLSMLGNMAQAIEIESPCQPNETILVDIVSSEFSDFITNRYTGFDRNGKSRIIADEIYRGSSSVFRTASYFSPSQNRFPFARLDRSQFTELGRILSGASHNCPVVLTVVCKTGRIDRISPTCKMVNQ